MTDNGQARVSRNDPLVRWERAAKALGVTGDALTSWYEAGFVPAVQSPGLMFTYQSWIDDVRNGPRPGKAANVAEIGRRWFSTHLGVPALRGVA
jgi:hypothetical protein